MNRAEHYVIFSCSLTSATQNIMTVFRITEARETEQRLGIHGSVEENDQVNTEYGFKKNRYMYT